jgi:hypothetical protein
MNRTGLYLIALSSSFALGGVALAAQTTDAGYVAKAAYRAKNSASLAHTRETGTQVGSRDLVLGWNGSFRGPGARGAYVALVPSKGDHAHKLAATKISRDLEQKAAKLVRAHLDDKGLTGRIQFGDRIPNKSEIDQRPVTRGAGALRFTVTDSKGKSTRYLVQINPRALVRGGSLLGTVAQDNSTIGLKNGD